MSVIRCRGLASFVGDAARRYREADGTSHTRALAFQSVFVMLSGFIGVVGLASVLDLPQVRAIVQQLALTLSPGPSGRLLEEAARQGTNGGTTAMAVGLAAAAVAGTLAMAQVERSANRIFGVRHDPPAVRRYVAAFLLAITAGLLLVVGGLVLGAGRAIERGAGWDEGLAAIWAVARWPLGVLVVGVGVYFLYRAAPRERRASTRALAAGAIVAVALWAAFTALLGLYFSMSSESSQTYGPLLAVIALLLWSALASLALHLGLAVAAELSEERPSGDRRTVRIPDSAEDAAEVATARPSSKR